MGRFGNRYLSGPRNISFSMPLSPIWPCDGHRLSTLIGKSVRFECSLCILTKASFRIVFVFAMGYLSWLHFYRAFMERSYVLDVTG